MTNLCEICPESAPIENNGICESCPIGTYYDFTKKICFECGEGTTIDENK